MKVVHKYHRLNIFTIDITYLQFTILINRLILTCDNKNFVHHKIDIVIYYYSIIT